MNLALKLWFALSVASLIVYAFTGMGLWLQLDPRNDGFIRFILLFGFHIGGLMAYPMYRQIGDSK